MIPEMKFPLMKSIAQTYVRDTQNGIELLVRLCESSFIGIPLSWEPSGVYTVEEYTFNPSLCVGFESGTKGTICTQLILSLHI